MKVILIEDQNLLASALASALDKDDIELVGQSDKASDVLNLCRELAPDLVIMDVYTKEGNGIEYTARLKKTYPKTKVLVISGMNDDRLIQAAEEAGADFFAWKDLALDDLLDMVRNSKKPYRIFPNADLEQKESARLSHVDMKIISLLANGKSTREIADELYLGYGTVRLYISRLYTVTGLKSRAQLVAYALRLGLIGPV